MNVESDSPFKPDRSYAVKWAVYQVEVCPTTGNKHWQVAVGLHQPSLMSTVKAILINGQSAHCEIAHDVPASIRYCQKEETRYRGPWIIGDLPAQGKRTDIQEAMEAAKAGMPELELMENFPMVMARYGAMINRYRALTCPKRTEPPQVLIYWGAAGTGKSRRAHTDYPDAYVKLDGRWWDGYDNQESVIIDDFYGNQSPSLSYDAYLKLTDRYSYMAEVKGGSVRLDKVRTIVFTSNLDPENWFRGSTGYDRSAFFRRVSRIIHFREDGSQVEQHPLAIAPAPIIIID